MDLLASLGPRKDDLRKRWIELRSCRSTSQAGRFHGPEHCHLDLVKENTRLISLRSYAIVLFSDSP